ncbi:aconitase X swivel domain-containing protein [Nitrosopumilus adriaticus]|uniref:aconitase X swivel domain-containing protein n=1 Tax=Nitrosopumilus adriaticus TaxID=1580092 RepID=UPI00352D9144
MKVLVAGKAQGTVLKSEKPINFLGTVDKKTGVISDNNHELYRKSIKDVILVFPSGVGSSVGAYTIYSIKSNNSAPLAMICQKADLTVATGCALANIPLITLSDEEFDAIKNGMTFSLDTDSNLILYQ